MSATPLARLLAMSYRTIIDDLHGALREEGWTDVRENYGYVLLNVRNDSVTVTDLAGLLGVTKQATSKLLDAMEAGGYVVRGGADGDGRAKLVSIAPRGLDLLAVVEKIYERIEASWADVIGERALAQTRDRLELVLHNRFGNDLPRLRPT
jgi:DNA-binding MarR family transcriptional regulator